MGKVKMLADGEKEKLDLKPFCLLFICYASNFFTHSHPRQTMSIFAKVQSSWKQTEGENNMHTFNYILFRDEKMDAFYL